MEADPEAGEVHIVQFHLLAVVAEGPVFSGQGEAVSRAGVRVDEVLGPDDRERGSQRPSGQEEREGREGQQEQTGPVSHLIFPFAI